jgi:hypothetical protein
MDGSLGDRCTRTTRILRGAGIAMACGAACLAVGTARGAGTGDVAVELRGSPCEVAAASPWINRWLAAWELTSREILRLPDAPPPTLVFYDSSCVYTTSSVSAGGGSPEDGPALRGARLPWQASAHGDTLTLPDSSRVPVQLMSFTNVAPESGPFFLMAAPSYWAQTGHGREPGLTAVFLHEFAHTRQIRGMAALLDSIEAGWSFPDELGDDSVQLHFSTDSTYVAEYLLERDLLYRAAAAESTEEARALGTEALAMVKSRHARWFTGDNAVFTALDDTFLSLEGSAQWAGYAWLAHSEGGGLEREAAIEKMLGRRRWWSQDEGLALFLVIDRLLPGWPLLVFREPSAGALELLEQAVRRP